MRLLIVSQYFWPESFRINDLVKTLTDRGIEVDVLTGKPNYPEGRVFGQYQAWGFQVESWAGATVFRVPLFPRGAKSAMRLAANYLSFIVSGLVLGPWLLRGRKYDVVFVYGVSPIFQAVPAIALGRLKRAPVILWVQDLWPESLKATGYIKSSRVLSVVGWLVGQVYKRVDLLLAQSRAFVPFIQSLAPDKSVLYFPNSVDDTFSAPVSVAPPVIPALDRGFPVVFAGNIGAGQAVEVIVEAAVLLKELPEISFVVVGQGSRYEWMCQQVRTLELSNLHLPGRFPVETMPGLMQKAGALLVSLADEPIFAATVPNKVQAYMASGRPILASLNGEGARLIHEANAGLTCPAGDGPALADAVLRLYRMTEAERAWLGANGRQYFQTHFDHSGLTDQLVGHMQDISSSHRENK